MSDRDTASGSISAAVARMAGAVAACGLIGTAIVGLQSAAASPSAPTPASPAAPPVTMASAARVGVDWADVARPATGSVRVPARVDSMPAGAVVSTELARLDGQGVTGVLFDPDAMSLTVDAGAAPGRYRVTVHVVRGGVEIARATDEFVIR